MSAGNQRGRFRVCPHVVAIKFRLIPSFPAATAAPAKTSPITFKKSGEQIAMGDILMITGTFLFFLGAVGYLYGCDRLGENKQ